MSIGHWALGIDRLTRRVLSGLAAAGGLALFVWAVRRAGTAAILDGVARVGWGLIAILAIGGARFLLRAASWRLCLPPGAPLTLARCAAAFVAGDAVGSVTPLGLVASEPTKIFLTRHHLATRESVASLALENLVYAASVLAMIAAGLIVLLVTVPVPTAWRGATFGALAAIGVALGVAALLVRGTRTASTAPVSQQRGWRARLWAVCAEVGRFSAAHPSRLLAVFALDLAYHALAVLEVFLTLGWLLGDLRPTLAQAIVFEALNRVVTVAFKFVPFRVGVDEALTGALARVLVVNPAAGVALAVVRKVRNLFWAGIGLSIVAAHPARSRS